ncbi:MAG: prepilin-type N-terminal cleavage/methylation domain-containing protein [Alphaproteobacteria bacterium]
MKNPKIQAFTLIELSIVIIIIGIIIGGIAAGNELLMQARIRGLINETQNVKAAINAFKLKFNALPGDFTRAGRIWTSATCTNANAPAGCNGNGDYKINLAGGGANGQEGYRFWQHLSLGGFINGTYTGTSAKTDQYKLSYSPSAYMNARYVRAYGSGWLDNYLEIGAWNSTLGLAIEGELTPIDAYGLDIKIDDGVAGTGKVLGGDRYTTLIDNLCSYPTGPVLPLPLPDYNLLGEQGPFCRMKVSMD